MSTLEVRKGVNSPGVRITRGLSHLTEGLGIELMSSVSQQTLLTDETLLQLGSP